MNTTKRVDPRRRYVIGPSGLRRAVLGFEAVADGIDAAGTTGNARAQALPRGAAGHSAMGKPRRAIAQVERVLLVAAHSDRGSLDEHARQAVAAAAIVAGTNTEVVLVVFGELTDDAAELGADKVVAFDELGRPGFAPDRELAALQACVAAFGPHHLLMPDNATGDGDLGRRYAAQARASIATHVVEIDAAQVSVHIDAGRRLATREWPQVILLAPDAVSSKLPFTGAGQAVDRRPLAAANGGRMADAGVYRDHGTSQLDAAEIALEEADFIVSAGNGVTDIAAFGELARAFGAAIGASRVAVDNGHFTRDKQVGATGKTVNASVYIAFGISGAVQHLQGIKDCRHVIAVNLDASAPIAKRANLTVVADARTTISALIEAVANARASAKHAPAMPTDTTIREGVAA